jgi:hypothetical protein
MKTKPISKYWKIAPKHPYWFSFEWSTFYKVERVGKLTLIKSKSQKGENGAYCRGFNLKQGIKITKKEFEQGDFNKMLKNI